MPLNEYNNLRGIHPFVCRHFLRLSWIFRQNWSWTLRRGPGLNQPVGDAFRPRPNSHLYCRENGQRWSGCTERPGTAFVLVRVRLSFHFSDCFGGKISPANKKRGQPPRPPPRTFYQVSPYSRTKIFLLAHISFRIFGQTVTLTSPRCALRSNCINVRDCPMPPPIESGILLFRIAW